MNSLDIPGLLRKGRSLFLGLAVLFVASVDIHSSTREAQSDSQPSNSPSSDQIVEEEKLSPEKIAALAEYTHSDVERIPTMIENGKISKDCIQENDVWSFRNCMQKKGLEEWCMVQVQIFEDADFNKPFQWSIMWRSVVGFVIYCMIGGPLKAGMDNFGEKSPFGSMCGCLGALLTIGFGLPTIYFFFAALL